MTRAELTEEMKKFRISFTGSGKKFMYIIDKSKKYSIKVDSITINNRLELLKLFSQYVQIQAGDYYFLDQKFLDTASMEELTTWYDQFFNIMLNSPGFKKNVNHL